jgi:hypothetical protein
MSCGWRWPSPLPGASTSAKAVQAFRDWLQDAVGCITQVRLDASPDWQQPATRSAGPHTISLSDDGLPLLLDGTAQIALTVNHHYRIVHDSARGEWHVQTAAYYYAIDAQGGGEILSYHWHPGVGIDFPHVHVSSSAVNPDVISAAKWAPGANALRADLAKAHLPTGRIALEDVISLLIEQFDVPGRGHWKDTLRASRAEFEQNRRWSEKPPVAPQPASAAPQSRKLRYRRRR